MSPGWRRLALFIHVMMSVAFPGAVGCFLVLAISGLASGRPEAYAAMDLLTSWVILPLCILSLGSGLVSSVGTHWGVVRYYWIVVKLVLTTLSTLALLVHLRPIRAMAATAEPSMMQPTQIQLVAASAVAVLVLVLLTGLSVYKPRGLTPYGARRIEG